jgi:hypothetical protein
MIAPPVAGDDAEIEGGCFHDLLVVLDYWLFSSSPGLARLRGRSPFGAAKAR